MVAEPMVLADVAKFALELPEVVEQDHHGMRSFRIGGKIFASVPDELHVRIMLDEHGILAAVAEEPEACSEFWWGKKLACVQVEIERASPSFMKEMLEEAWRRKAPSRLL